MLSIMLQRLTNKKLGTANILYQAALSRDINDLCIILLSKDQDSKAGFWRNIWICFLDFVIIMKLRNTFF